MKNILFFNATIVLILLFPHCGKQDPGKVEIVSVDNLTHNSMVVYFEMKDLESGVGLQNKGIWAVKDQPMAADRQSFLGSGHNGSSESCLAGVSGLEPDTKYIIRAYFETNEGILTSDTMVVKTKPIDLMTDSRDGKKYPFKTYGKQAWIIQNIDYQTPGCLVFENNHEKIPAEFGKLYSYQEAGSACPSGWHLPSDEEWKMLEAYIGIPESELDKTASRGSPAGGMMKEPGMRLWESVSAQHSDNRSGFSVVPSGWYRTDKKEFTYSKTCAGFWSGSEDSKTAFLRFFYVNSDAVSRIKMDINSLQLSVRCIKN